MRGSHSTRWRLLMDALALAHGRPFDALALAHGRPFDANAVKARRTGHVRKRVECPEQAPARRMGIFSKIRNLCLAGESLQNNLIDREPTRQSFRLSNARTASACKWNRICLHPRLLGRCHLRRKRRRHSKAARRTRWTKRCKVYPRSSRSATGLRRRTARAHAGGST